MTSLWKPRSIVAVAGAQKFHNPFPSAPAVTVSGSPAAYTMVNGVITLNTPCAGGETVVFTPVDLLVSGAFTGTGQSAAISPIPEQGFNVSLWGTFVASVRLERSLDNGTTWLPITAGGSAMFTWTSPASEENEEPESGALYRLNCTAYTSGTVNYRISQ